MRREKEGRRQLMENGAGCKRIRITSIKYKAPQAYGH
jgi:hypothetical protein